MKSIVFCHLLARWFAEHISSTLKMEAICSSETSVETQRTTRRHIPEDDILRIFRLHKTLFMFLQECRRFRRLRYYLLVDTFQRLYRVTKAII
jgi:hypothetical protein